MRTVLLIEDDEGVRDNIAEMLELAGYRVLPAANGKRGVELARAERPDLVLCDIMMPELDGYGVLHVVGRDPKTSDIPFIFLTARTEPTDIRKGMDLGADDYLTKPFEKSTLLSAIEGRLERSDRFRRSFLQEGAEGFERFLEEARGVGALKDLGRDRKVRKVRKKDMLFHEGDELRQVPLLVKGNAHTFKINADGKVFITGLCAAGDLIGHMGLLQGGLAIESAEMLEDGEVSMVPREDLLALLYRDRDVSMRFIKMLARNVADKEQDLLQLAYASVRQRVARMLLRAQAHYVGDGQGPAALRMSREDMASMVGTAHETITRCLADLKEEGLIGTQGREVLIRNKVGLERVARG